MGNFSKQVIKKKLGTKQDLMLKTLWVNVDYLSEYIKRLDPIIDRLLKKFPDLDSSATKES